MKKLIALILMLALICSLAMAEAVQPKNDVFEYVGLDFDQVFSAVFAENQDDRMLANLTAATLLGSTPDGDIILDGKAGMTTSYKGEETTYYGVGSVETVSNADGTVDYNITMREDVVFADGHGADIDDVLFTIYVLSDPSYDGPVYIRHLPILGLEAYSGTAAALSDLLIEAGRDNTDFEYWDEETQTTFWSELDAAGAAMAQEIVDYIMENYLTGEYTAEIGKTVDQVKADPQLQIQLGMTMWGYGHAYFDGATTADYWQVILNEYGGDVLLAAETEAVDSGIFDLIEGYEEKYGGIVYVGDPVDAIEGVIRTGDYSMTIRASEESDAILYALAELPVMPLHYYGDEEGYAWENNAFGFEKGNLLPLREKDAAPMGCGAYAFSGYADGVATLEANVHYFGGETEFKQILMKEE